MLMTRYEPLIFNANFTETSSDGKYVAYRGELTICEGEVADAQAAASRRPKCSNRQVACWAKATA